MRGFGFFLAFVASLPFVFVSPFNGVLLWYVFSLGVVVLSNRQETAADHSARYIDADVFDMDHIYLVVRTRPE